MTRRAPLHILAQSMLAAALTCTLLATPALAQPGEGQGKNHAEKSGHGRSGDKRDSADDKGDDSQREQQHQSLSPQEAAGRARAKYGGQVLKVSPAGRGYQVRLLGDDGRVTTVSIGD
jgi:hypothetical protein